MLAGPHFIGKFIDYADNYLNKRKDGGLIVPDEFIDRSLMVLEIMERGLGMEVVLKNKKYKFNDYSDIHTGDVVIINRYNTLPLILESIEKDSDYYVGVMGDVIGIISKGDN